MVTSILEDLEVLYSPKTPNCRSTDAMWWIVFRTQFHFCHNILEEIVTSHKISTLKRIDFFKINFYMYCKTLFIREDFVFA